MFDLGIYSECGPSGGLSSRSISTKSSPSLASQRTETSNELSQAEVSEHIWRVKEGHDSSFVVLLNYLRPYIDKILNTRLKSKQCKEDTKQEIHIRVYRKLGQYSVTVPFRNWVSRIAVNACTDRYSRKRRQAEISFGDLNEEQAQYIEETRASIESELHSESWAARETIAQHLSLLNSDDQLVIRLFYLEGLTHQEIAKQAGWTESHSKVRAHRARKKLVNSIRATETLAEAKWLAQTRAKITISETQKEAA